MADQTEVTRSNYDEWHAAREVDYESDAPWHRMLKPLVRDEIGGKRVLEIACGRGGFAAWLAGGAEASQRPKELVAADFSKVALEKAARLGKERGLTNVTYQQADLMALPWDGASFDAAISCETIEHTPEPRQALKELARVLRPGGRLFLTCPSYVNLMGLHRVYRTAAGKDVAEESQPINHFLLLPRLTRWLQAAGLTVERASGVGHYLPVPGRPPVRVEFLDSVPGAWPFALHVLFVARKA